MHTTVARRSWVLLTMLTGLLVLSLVGAPSAHACSCAPRTFDDAIAGSDLIADITVQHSIGTEDGDIVYYAAVDTVWKGEESRTIHFSTSDEGTACGLGALRNGESLLVWANGADGEYSSTWCALPMDGGPDDRERLTQELGEPADLTEQSVPLLDPSAPFSSRPVTVGLAILAGIGALAVGAGVVAVAAVLILRRRP